MKPTQKKLPKGMVAAIAIAAGMTCAGASWAQSPELALREFASGQIKKGVRSIGFGGDGATWGNYGLVWKDAGGAVADAGDTRFSNGNDFSFDAIGITSPLLWHDLAIYAIVLNQNTNDIHLKVKSPGLGPDPLPVVGHGSNHAVFTKAAMPLGYGFSAGILLSHEVSEFSAHSEDNSGKAVRYETEWRPSGGWGVAWQQPGSSLLVGFRAVLNRDMEHRTDSAGERGASKNQRISPRHFLFSLGRRAVRRRGHSPL